MTLEVKSVQSYENSPALVTSGHIDIPIGRCEYAHTLRILGWILPNAIPVRAINVTWQNSPLASTTASVSRSDVAAVFPDSPHAPYSGYALMVPMLEVNGAFTLTIQAEFADGTLLTLGQIVGHHDPIRTDSSFQLNPLLITHCIGRSGTTWLMRLLGEHPEIVVHKHYPYEMNYLGYWMHVLTVLALPGAPKARDADVFLSPDHVGHNPAYHKNTILEEPLWQWINSDQVEMLATDCQKYTAAFYQQVADGQGKP